MQSLQDEISMYFSLEELKEYLSHRPQILETQILESAHFYASKWEFDIIYHFNPNMYGVKEIKDKIDKQLHNNEHLFEAAFWGKGRSEKTGEHVWAVAFPKTLEPNSKSAANQCLRAYLMRGTYGVFVEL